MTNAIFYFSWLCNCDRSHQQQSTDSFDAWCAGPRSMDCSTETALTAD